MGLVRKVMCATSQIDRRYRRYRDRRSGECLHLCPILRTVVQGKGWGLGVRVGQCPIVSVVPCRGDSDGPVTPAMAGPLLGSAFDYRIR